MLIETAHGHVFDHVCPQWADGTLGGIGGHQGFLSRAEGCWTFDARDRTPRPSRATAHHFVENALTQTPAPSRASGFVHRRLAAGAPGVASVAHSGRSSAPQKRMASGQSFDGGQSATSTNALRRSYHDRYPADCDGLFVEPHVFAARPVEDAVDQDDLTLDPGPHTGAAVGVKDDRPRVLLGQFALDLPQYLLPARRVALHRLLLDQLVDIVVAIAVPVDAGAAAIEQIEDRIGIRAAGLQVEADRVFLAHDLRVVAGGVDRLEFGFDVNLPQLIDQDDRRVAVEADI